MGAQGTAIIDFGSRATDTTVSVTGQSEILSNSLAEAWVFPTDTASNTADNHWVDDIEVVAGNVQAGTGFTIYAKCRTGFAHGEFQIGWVWN
jgi:hypothetical protein